MIVAMLPYHVAHPQRSQNPAGIGAAAGAALGASLSTFGMAIYQMERERRATETGVPITEDEQRKIDIAHVLLATATATLGAYMFARPMEEGYAAAGAATGVILPAAISFALKQKPKKNWAYGLYHIGAPVLGAFGGGLVGAQMASQQRMMPPANYPQYPMPRAA